ncbi:MAG: class I SAM-dependent methyltransferase [Candidatus Polarisedimenticolaceae bacterium]|nr:class I SAM-dependent methyltransferase [Candidatus Polarisedimenticolaceae bacterium]
MRRYTADMTQPDFQQRLHEWLQQSPGQVLLEQEQQCLEQIFSELFGHHLVQLGGGGFDFDLSGVSRFRAHLVLDACMPTQSLVAHVRADPLELPILSATVDAVLMPHTLDFSADPHRILREVERILIPEGRVVILGFNPLSLWGLWRLFKRSSTAIPWQGHFLGAGRISDWLSLLGFDLEITRQLMFRPPLRGQGMMARLERMERIGQRFWPRLSSVYVMQAVKRVSTMTMVGPIWQRKASLLGGRIIEPTTRESNE